MEITKMMVMALLFLVLGAFYLGMSVGEKFIIRQERRSKIIRAEGYGNHSLTVAVTFIVAAIIFGSISG